MLTLSLDAPTWTIGVQFLIETKITCAVKAMRKHLCFLTTPEPIIKPVKNKQFTLMEQELPATVYDME